MPIKRYAKIGYTSELSYYLWRKTHLNKRRIIKFGMATRDEAEMELDEIDPLFPEEDLDPHGLLNGRY